MFTPYEDEDSLERAEYERTMKKGAGNIPARHARRPEALQKQSRQQGTSATLVLIRRMLVSQDTKGVGWGCSIYPQPTLREVLFSCADS